MSEIEKSVADFMKTASEKEKIHLKLLLEYLTEKISAQTYFKEANALGWETHDFYIACILAVLTKSVVSVEKKIKGIENKLEKQTRFSGEKKAYERGLMSKKDEKEEDLLKELCGNETKLYDFLSRSLYANPIAVISKKDLSILIEEAEKSIKDENYEDALRKYHLVVDKAIFEATQNPGEKGRYIKVIQDLASKTAKVTEKVKEKVEKEGLAARARSLEGQIENYEFLSERIEDVIKIASLFYNERLELLGAKDRREVRREQREGAEGEEQREEKKEKERREARSEEIKKMGRKERKEAETEEKRIELGEKEKREARREERIEAEGEEKRIEEKEKERGEARRKERRETRIT